MTQEFPGATVLLLDDEAMVVQSLKGYLELETPWSVTAFTEVAEALKHVRDQPVDIVVSDYVMPAMNGIDFLIAVKEAQPLATRILLTGYTDKENAIRAINEVGIFQYVEKPWDNEALALVLRNGLEKRFLLRRLEQLVRELDASKTELTDVHNAIVKAFI